MARYSCNYTISVHPEVIFNSIRDFLFNEGYEYVNLNGEWIFRKEYSHIKVIFMTNMVVIEAWHTAEVEQYEIQSVGQRLRMLETMILSIQYQENQQLTYQRQTTILSRQNITSGEYYKSYVDEKMKKDLTILCVIMYLGVGANVVSGIMLMGNVWGVIDGVLLLGLTLGIHLAKSRVCAIIILCYGVINFIMGIIFDGQIVGWLWIVYGIIALVHLNNMHKEYRKFKAGN